MKPTPRKVRPPAKKKLLDLRILLGILLGTAGLTVLSFLLPWRNTAAGGEWFWVFPEGWVAGLAAFAGWIGTLGTLGSKKEAAQRRKSATASLLGSLGFLAAVGVFAVRTLAAKTDETGSGAGALLGSVLVLAWVFAAAGVHARMRMLERRPAPAPAPAEPG